MLKSKKRFLYITYTHEVYFSHILIHTKKKKILSSHNVLSLFQTILKKNISVKFEQHLSSVAITVTLQDQV